MPLSAIKVKQAKPKEKGYKLFDANGLYLWVTPTGSKLWRLKYYFAGKEKTLAIGSAGDISLAKAREKRDAARQLLTEGLDPSAEKVKAKQAKRAAVDHLFQTVARAWFEARKARWTPKYAVNVISSLERELFPTLGRRAVEDIHATDVIEAIDKIQRRGASELAGRTLQRVKAIFRYATQQRIIQFNPISDLVAREIIMDRPPVRHQPALPKQELRTFFAKLDKANLNITTREGILLAMLTLTRTGELIGARWEEIDLDNALWEIPATRMKNKLPHVVPLSKQAVESFERLQPVSGHFEHVFIGNVDPKKTISNNTLLFGLYRMGYRGKATIHGMRALGSSILNEATDAHIRPLFNPDAIERQLAHVPKNAVRAAYNRADYLQERTRLLQWLADHYESHKLGANVVELTKKSA